MQNGIHLEFQGLAYVEHSAGYSGGGLDVTGVLQLRQQNTLVAGTRRTLDTPLLFDQSGTIKLVRSLCLCCGVSATNLPAGVLMLQQSRPVSFCGHVFKRERCKWEASSVDFSFMGPTGSHVVLPLLLHCIEFAVGTMLFVTGK